ncbi:MAG: hypothetical protein ACPGN3_10640 [Opitutales bacterium]
MNLLRILSYSLALIATAKAFADLSIEVSPEEDPTLVFEYNLYPAAFTGDAPEAFFERFYDGVRFTELSNIEGLSLKGKSILGPEELSEAELWLGDEFLSVLPTDLDGNISYFNESIFEFDSLSVKWRYPDGTVFADIKLPSRPFSLIRVLYVDADTPTSGDGSSWGQAFKHFDEAYDAWSGYFSRPAIWIAEGVYHNSQTKHSGGYILLSGMEIYGGFDGTESSISQRDLQSNITVISGDRFKDDFVDSRGILPDPAQKRGPNARLFRTDFSLNGMLNSTTLLDGLVLTAGNFGSGHGGAISLDTGADIQLRNLYFIGNYANNTGGAIGMNWQCNPKVSNVIFESNHAREGGGAVSIADASYALPPAYTYRYIRAEFQNCRFIRNRTDDYGGAFLYEYMFGGSYGAEFVFGECEFLGNSALSGGAVAMITSNGQNRPEFHNCIFNGNAADQSGGALFLAVDSPYLHLQAYFVNNTFHANRAPFASHMYIRGQFTTENQAPRRTKACLGFFINSIIWDNHGYSTNKADLIFNRNALIVFINSIIQSGLGTTAIQNYLDGRTVFSGGNSIKDPLFRDSDGPDNIKGNADDILLPSTQSPAIDAGIRYYGVSRNRYVDFEGNQRVVDGNADGKAIEDIGALEIQ